MESKEELKIIKTAILNEVEGQFFYRLAAEKTESEEVRDAFLVLAGEEEKHEKWLRNLFDQAADGAGAVVAADEPGVFTWDHAGTETGSIEVSAFHIGILMEKSSVDFYRQAAAKTALPAAKQLYENLIKWEENHLASLEKIYDNLKEEWWGKQGFSPA